MLTHRTLQLMEHRAELPLAPVNPALAKISLKLNSHTDLQVIRSNCNCKQRMIQVLI